MEIVYEKYLSMSSKNVYLWHFFISSGIAGKILINCGFKLKVLQIEKHMKTIFITIQRWCQSQGKFHS